LQGAGPRPTRQFFNNLLGSTATGELELHETDAGLAFLLRPAPDADGRELVRAVKGGELQMSLGYVTDSATTRNIDGTDVRFIDEASLSEISAVERPAIAATAITVVPAGTIDNLADWCRNGSMKSLVTLAHIERRVARLFGAAPR
jgi:HK97 family phage prohead protease